MVLKSGGSYLFCSVGGMVRRLRAHGCMYQCLVAFCEDLMVTCMKEGE